MLSNLITSEAIEMVCPTNKWEKCHRQSSQTTKKTEGKQELQRHLPEATEIALDT